MLLKYPVSYCSQITVTAISENSVTFFILYWAQYPGACVVIPAKAGIQNLDASVRWHDKYLDACSEDYLFG